jgi:predicted Ser/Thr protein kinase
MEQDPELEARLSRFVEHHVQQGTCLPLETLCEGRPDLAQPLGALIKSYLDLSARLDTTAAGPIATLDQAPGEVPAALPQFEGFRTIERVGGGGMGEVFKLQDLKLDRIVAGKVVRRDRGRNLAFNGFLQEARAMALFQDRRIVQIYEFRSEADPPVIIMEFVDGFELGRIAPSLEFRQRAHIVEQVAEAIDHAHRLGIQHRDLKPSNVMLDGALAPKILDFGLSASDSAHGHLRGTLPYLAPEQLDPRRSIDARTDVYALGVILYEILCGAVPYSAADDIETIAAVREAQPRLPVEIEPSVPEPLQAIALKAMESDPAARYQSAREMALDLRRYLDGRPVSARPGAYASALESRVRPHLEHIDEWQRLRLIYPHEAGHLKAAYRGLEVREEDWIVSSRALSFSQIALYLGAFFLLAGSLYYFAVDRYYRHVEGLLAPFLVLGLPFLGLNAAAHYLYKKEHRAVAVAFYLGGVSLLPLFLLILFHKTGFLVKPDNTPGQLFATEVSNHQLQLTILIACVWSAFLALRTRTIALSTVFTILVFLMALAILSDFGLRSWLLDEKGLRLDLLALHLAPLVAFYAAVGLVFERAKRPWFGRPLYLAAALTFMVVLELAAWDGKAFAHLGIQMEGIFPGVAEPTTLNTFLAMTLNGVLMYFAAASVDRFGSEVMNQSGGLLFTVSPFATLKPLGYLCMTAKYWSKLNWISLALSLGSCLLAHQRQRRSFYYAGVINTGWALFVIAKRNTWYDKNTWAIALVVSGLLALMIGFGVDRWERFRRRG